MGDQFRKKPVTIRAWCFVKDLQRPAWLEQRFNAGNIWYQGGDDPYCTIKTLEGDMRASLGDWIIEGVQGEIYPCKPDIFAATYEPAAPAVADTDKTVGERFTLVFAGNLKKFAGNPFHTDTPFGRPVGCGLGDAFAEIAALEGIVVTTPTAEDDTPPPADPALLASANRALKAQLDERDQEIAALRDAAVELVAAANGLVDRDVQYHEGEIRIPGVGHTAAIHRVRELRQAVLSTQAILTQPKGDA